MTGFERIEEAALAYAAAETAREFHRASQRLAQAVHRYATGLARVYCGCGCGVWWHQARGVGHPREYLDSIHQAWARNRRRRGVTT